jgi:hypothetical protein
MSILGFEQTAGVWVLTEQQLVAIVFTTKLMNLPHLP